MNLPASDVLTESVDKSSPAFFVFMLLFVCAFIISVRKSIAIFYIANCESLREIKVAEVDCLGLYQLGIKTKGSEEKMGVFTGLPDSRCMFYTSVSKERGE